MTSETSTRTYDGVVVLGVTARQAQRIWEMTSHYDFKYSRMMRELNPDYLYGSPNFSFGSCFDPSLSYDKPNMQLQLRLHDDNGGRWFLLCLVSKDAKHNYGGVRPGDVVQYMRHHGTTSPVVMFEESARCYERVETSYDDGAISSHWYETEDDPRYKGHRLGTPYEPVSYGEVYDMFVVDSRLRDVDDKSMFVAIDYGWDELVPAEEVQ